MKAFIILYSFVCFNANSIADYFGNTYNQSIKSLKTDAIVIEREAQKLKIDPEIIKSIVFPEYLRSNILSGLIEEKSLEALYVQNGNSDVDFSIGKFQIKPSFATQIENFVVENKYNLKSRYQFLIISSKNPIDERTIRLARLKDLKWQTRYLAYFVEYGINHLGIKTFSLTETIKYLATLYNFGLINSKTEIESYFDCKCFPYGKKYDIDQVNYWEASLSYYIEKK